MKINKNALKAREFQKLLCQRRILQSDSKNARKFLKNPDNNFNNLLKFYSWKISMNSGSNLFIKRSVVIFTYAS